MDRRKFIGAFAGNALLASLAAKAQQPAMPVIGYLSSRSAADSANIVAAFRQGLNEAGFVDKRNVVIEERFAEGNLDRLPALAADLVRRQVSVLVATGGSVTAVKAKPVVPATIPMVFAMGGDPVQLGVVASLNRPGGNITGVTFLITGLAAKLVEILHELVPKGAVIGFLVNPRNLNAESSTRDVQTAADALGHKLAVAKSNADSEIESAFAALVQQQVAGLVVSSDPFFVDRRAKIIALAARHALPAVYDLREFADAGGLVTYGTSIFDANRQLGVYAGRVLKGTKPADLPVVQSTRFELVINLKTAKALGLTIPQSVLLRADEVIE